VARRARINGKVEGLPGSGRHEPAPREYLTDREQGWQFTVDGLRAHDADRLRRGAQKEADAEKVAAQIRGRSGPD